MQQHKARRTEYVYICLQNIVLNLNATLESSLRIKSINWSLYFIESKDLPDYLF